MPKQKSEAGIRRIFRSKLLLSVEVLVLILMSVALGREVLLRYTIEREIAQLKAEFQELEQKNINLDQLISYFQSETFQEEEARTKLGLQKEGESVVILPQQTSEEVILSSNNGDLRSTTEAKRNPTKWWQYFFGSSHINT